MNKIELIRCTTAVLNFLLDEEHKEIERFNTPANESMGKILRKHGYGLNGNIPMVDFTIFLNLKLGIIKHPTLIWKKSPKEFFSNKRKSIKFFIEALNLLNYK